MEYMGNKEFWEDKFANRGDKRFSPENSLVEHIKYLKKGSVLDLACGDGRNSLFLLENGFKVTGVDFSRKALERLEKFANGNDLLSTKQIDLSDPNSLRDIGIFDNIIINHYRLDKEQLADIENHITENGILFVCGFGEKHKVDARIGIEDLIYSKDFEEINKSFDSIKYIEKQDEIGFFVTYIFEKRKPIQ